MADTRETELLPCPFCGDATSEFRGLGMGASQEMDEDGDYIEEGREWGVSCRSCGASSGVCESEADAAANWNRRPLPAPPEDDK